MVSNTFSFSVDRDARRVVVTRRFAAPNALVWSAWTEAEYLNRWWGPEPYRVETKEMDFRVGGRWLYAMVGPEGVVGHSRVNYTSITPVTEFRAHSSFCNADGEAAPGWSGSEWQVRFTPENDATQVDIRINYSDLAVLEKVLEMGFREGFTQGLNQLEDLLAKQQA